MSTLMRDWIGPAVRRELDAIRKCKAEYCKVAHGDDDRQAFMIRLREGKSIQVNQFITRTAPYFVLVSDSFTQIRAKFTAASTEAFTKKHGRSFSNRTLGAVLGITEYYLVCSVSDRNFSAKELTYLRTLDPNAPRSRRVMLKIESFTLQGSEGSGNFGKPILVEKIAGISEALSKISEYDADSESRLHCPMDYLSTVQSQTSYSKNEPSRSGEPAETKFYTQAPPKLPHRNDVHGRSSIGVSLSERALMELLEPWKTQRLDDSTRTEGTKLTNRPPETQEQQLSSSHAQSSSTCPDSVSREAGASSQRSKFPLHPLAKSALASDTRHLQFQPNSSHPQTASLLEISTRSDNLRIKCTNTDFSGTSQQHSIDSEKENNQDGFTGRYTAVKSKSTKSTMPQTPSAKGLKNYNAPHPWEGLARIPRKFVQISKDQRTLLNRDDSWYSPAALTGANKPIVPSNVIKSLQDFHSHGASMEMDATSQHDAIETASYGGSDKECMEPSQKNPDKDVNHEEFSLPRTIDGKYSSQDEGDDNSSQPAISWSTSLVRTDSPFPNRQIRSGTVTDTSFNSPQPEIPLRERSPAECRATTIENGVEVTEVSGIHLFTSTISISNPLCQVLEAKSTKYHLPKLSMELSSSPVEMPLSVPHALCDQVNSSSRVSTGQHLDIRLPIPSTAEQGQPTLQVQRTPYNKVGSRSSHRTRSLQSHVRISSGPFIPATFDDEATNLAVQTASGSSSSQTQLKEYNMGAVRAISSTPNLPTPTVIAALPSLSQNSGGVTQARLQPEHERSSQRDCDIGAVNLVKRDHLSTSLSGEASLNHQQTLLRSQNNTQPEEIVEQQAITPRDFQQVEDNMSLIQSGKVKRTGSCISDQFHPAPKRRRTVQVAPFAQCQGSDTVMDPSEMAEANRRNFLNLLSIKRSSSEVDSLGSTVVGLPSTSFNQFDIAPQVGNDNDSRGFSITPDRTLAQQVNPLGSSSSDTANSSQLPRTKRSRSCRELSNGPVDHRSTKSVETPSTEKENSRGTTLGTIASQQTTIMRSPTFMPIEHQEIKDVVHGPVLASILVTMDSNNQMPNIFEFFQSEYPTYRGSHRSFIRACVYLESIKSQKYSPPSALWDDLIRVFCDEYIGYRQECLDSSEEPIAAVNFYEQYVPEPTFTKCILKADTLSDALFLNENLTARYRKLCRQKSPHHMSRDSVTVSPTQLSDGSYRETVNHEISSSSCQSSLRLRQVPRPVRNSTDYLSAMEQRIASKQPFFQTESQMRASSNRHKSYSFQRGVKTYPREATLESTGDGRAVGQVSLDNGVGLVPTPIRNNRPFPVSSPAPGTTEARELLKPTIGGQASLQTDETISTCPSIVEDVHQKAWQQTKSHGKLYKLREASPILGNTISNLILPTRTVSRPIASSTMMSDFRTCQISGAKFPRLLESRNLASGGSSLSSSAQSDLHELRTRRNNLGFLPEAALESPQLLSAAAIESFREFSKVFVPRRKRTSRVSTPARTYAW